MKKFYCEIFADIMIGPEMTDTKHDIRSTFSFEVENEAEAKEKADKIARYFDDCDEVEHPYYDSAVIPWEEYVKNMEEAGRDYLENYQKTEV